MNFLRMAFSRTIAMRSAIGAAAARAARALMTMALAPFYAAGWLVAAVVVAARHVAAATATGWEDVMGPATPTPTPQPRTPKPPAPAPERLSEPGAWWPWILFIAFLTMFMASLVLWVVSTWMMTHG